jgi:serralysin
MVKAFHHKAGEALRAYDAGSDLTTISLDVDGDAHADMVIGISGDWRGFTGFVL